MTNKKHFVLFCVLIYLISLFFLCYAHSVATSKDVALNGEELAVAYRNIVLLPQHIQSDCYATNFSGTIFYWVSSYFVPISINSQRIAKILIVAFLPLLMCLSIKKIKSDIYWPSLVIGALVLSCVPAYSWYGIQSIEAVLASVFAFVLILIIFDFSWKNKLALFSTYLFLIGLLMVWCVHFYGEVYSIIILSFAYLFIRLFDQKVCFMGFISFLLFCFFVLVASFWPKLYFGQQVVMFVGGGSVGFSLEKILTGINNVWNDIFIRSCSYLIGGCVNYSAFPWYLNGVLVSLLAFYGIYLVLRDRNRKGIWIACVAGLSIIIVLISGDNPGIRRMIPFIVCWIMLAIIGLEQVRTWPKGKAFYWILWLYLLSCSLFVFFGSYTYVSQNYKCWLQREFTYLPGKNYEQTIESLLLQKNIRFSRQIESSLKRINSVEVFVELHNKDVLYNEGKYAFTGDGRLILRGPMTDPEKAELQRLYPSVLERSLIESMFDYSREHMFQNPDTVMMLDLIRQRRGL